MLLFHLIFSHWATMHYFFLLLNSKKIPSNLQFVIIIILELIYLLYFVLTIVKYVPLAISLLTELNWTILVEFRVITQITQAHYFTALILNSFGCNFDIHFWIKATVHFVFGALLPLRQFLFIFPLIFLLSLWFHS